MPRLRLVVFLLVLSLCMPASAHAHGAQSGSYRTTIRSVEPADLPVDVRVVGDQLRFENDGDQVLELCGYATDACHAWVRIGPDGVFVDRNSQAWYANRDANGGTPAPEDAGEHPQFVRVRRAPAFYTYHDHRAHWMGGASLPANVDDHDPKPQLVYDGDIRFRYGTTDGVVRARVEYVGGRTTIERYAEPVLTGIAIVVMLVVFVLDAARRRRRRTAVADTRSTDATDG